MSNIIELLQNSSAMFITVCAVLGAIVGSFLNVVIFRIPKMMERAWLEESFFAMQHLQDEALPAADKDKYRASIAALQAEPAIQTRLAPITLSSPASTCPHCQHKIRAWENIPILSYVLLRGRCGQCKQPISLRYPIIEMVSTLLSAYVAVHFGFNWFAAAGLLLVWVLLALTMIDFDTQFLPDDLTLPLLWCGLLFNYFGGFVELKSAVLGAVFGYLSLWTVYWAFKLVTGKEGMGYGDFKLLAALGAWLGWQMLPLIILASALVGSVVGIVLIVFAKHGRNVPIPFGPYLAGGGLLALFWGNVLIHDFFPVLGL